MKKFFGFGLMAPAFGASAAEPAAETTTHWSQTVLFTVQDTTVTVGGVVQLLVVLVLAYLASRLIRRTLMRVSQRAAGGSRATYYALARIQHYILLLVALLIGLSGMGIDFSKLAILAGALGVGIGFGLQNIVNNFISGLIILLERSLKIGDFVELESGVMGEVREINIRNTLINTNDNVDILVPNAEFVNGRVTNMTLNEDIMRIRIPFGVAYGSDKERVKRAALRTAELVPFTLNRDGYHAQVFMTEFGDSSLNFLLVVWVTPEAVRMPGKVRSAYLWELDNQLREANIEIPFPQRDLHLRSDFRDRPDPDVMP